MKYCVDTKERGWTFKPERSWDGKKGFEFVITGYSDSNYAACTETRKSVTGYCVKLEGTPVIVKCASQKIMTLSVTEAELFAAVQCVQDMLYTARKILESIELKVLLPMVLHVDNKGAVDLINSWSVGGRTRHIETRQWFLRELKEQGIVKVKWIKGDDNEADLFTKNLPKPVFDKHAKKYCTD